MVETTIKVLGSIWASVVNDQIQSILSAQKKSLSKNTELQLRWSTRAGM